MWICTDDKKWFVCGVGKMEYIMWVNEKDRINATVFTEKQVDGWIRVLQKMTKLSLQIVQIY